MLRLARAQIAHGRARALALLAGILVATTAFTVLTGAAETGRLEARGAVARHFRTAYDILVRAPGHSSERERRESLVRPGAISGEQGGITLGQWRTVLDTPGVAVAAPIALIGYSLPDARVPIDLTGDLHGSGPQLFRVRVERITDRGLSRRQDVSTYVWVTRRELLRERGTGNVADPLNYAPRLDTPAGARPVCATDYQRFSPDGPFDLGPEGAGRGGPLGNLQCWSLVSGLAGEGRQAGGLARGHAAALIADPLPFVIAAIDPEQEAKLAGLDHAVTAGRYLRAGDRPTRAVVPAVPVLLSTRAFADERTEATIERLPAADARAITTTRRTGAALARWLHGRRGTPLRRVSLPPSAGLRAITDNGAVTAFWDVGDSAFDELPGGVLRPRTVRNPPEAWLAHGSGGYAIAPLSAEDRQFRRLRVHSGVAASQIGQVFAALHVVGRFDPEALPGFDDPISAPLQTYRTPALPAADARSRAALHGRPLLPNGNVAGYLTQPPLLLTNLRSLPRFGAPNYDPPLGRAPISAIRVRVAGVRGIDAVSRERVRRAAEAIRRRTGLAVDLTIGSSPAPQTIDLPAGAYGRPELRLTEPWVKQGVGVAILEAVDRKSVALFVLILVVCALFVANAASAAVRARRVEYGVLLALGWTTRRLCGAVLWELGLLGLAAGLLGTALALPASAALGVSVDPLRCALAVPAAVGLALAAGLVPALRAGRIQPLEAMRPAVHARASDRRPRGIVSLGLLNLTRVPGRSALGALSLAMGVSTLTLLLAVTLAFRGVLVGSLLGDLVSVQVRGVDYVAVVTTVLLGALSVADVIFLNLRERAPELGALLATGWTEGHLSRLVVAEGTGIGLVGALAGAAVGLVAAALLAGTVTLGLVAVTLLAALAGTLVAAVAALVPATLLARRPLSRALATE